MALDGSLEEGETYVLNLDIEQDDNHRIVYYEGFTEDGNWTATPPTETFDGRFVKDISSGSLIPGMTGISAIEDGSVLAYTVGFDGTGNDIQHHVLGHITDARIGDATAFSMPDLSKVEGWDTNWSIPADAVADYTLDPRHRLT